MVFLAITAVFAIFAMIFQVLASVPFVPVPAGIILLGVAVAWVAAYRRPAELEFSEEMQPFLPLQTQMVAYARASADCQKLGRTVELIDLARETLDQIPVPEALPEKLQAVQSLLVQAADPSPRWLLGRDRAHLWRPYWQEVGNAVVGGAQATLGHRGV